jgi:hypothetical protein
VSLQCPICMASLVALDRELAKYQDSARIPVYDVVTVLNQVSKGRLRVVVLPKEAHLEALEIAKQKMKERKVKITAEVADGLLRIPKNRYEEWWENDPEDPEARRLAMATRSWIASVWANEKYSGGVAKGTMLVAIARTHPISKVQVRQLLLADHEVHQGPSPQ